MRDQKDLTIIKMGLTRSKIKEELVQNASKCSNERLWQNIRPIFRANYFWD